MILALQPLHFPLLYRPSYVEIASLDIYKHYHDAEDLLIASREGSNFLRRTIATTYARKKLDELRFLADDWDSFGSEKPATEAIQTASKVVTALVTMDLVPDAIVPSAEGGVAICFVKPGRYADVECLNTGEVLAVTSTHGEKPHAWALDPDTITTASLESLSTYLSS